MTHELRTPLNAILGLSGMLLEDADDPDPRELRESLTRITGSARHLLGLINEILDLSKIEAGRMNVVTEVFSPAALAEEALATVAHMAREKGLTLRSAYASALPALDSDPQRVRQILINLLGNAVKFTDEGEVRLVVTGTAADLRFSVTDTGPGITPEDQAKLFQEFTQLDASRTRKFGGTGLGLAISRRMARLLGGEVTLQSDPGQGSTFMLVLPLQAPQAAARDNMRGDAGEPGEGTTVSRPGAPPGAASPI
jgi:signal transduction histidine kinase